MNGRKLSLSIFSLASSALVAQPDADLATYEKRRASPAGSLLQGLPWHGDQEGSLRFGKPRSQHAFRRRRTRAMALGRRSGDGLPRPAQLPRRPRGHPQGIKRHPQEKISLLPKRVLLSSVKLSFGKPGRFRGLGSDKATTMYPFLHACTKVSVDNAYLSVSQSLFK